MKGMAPRPAYGFFIRQNERTAIGNQETEPCPRTPCGSTGTCPGPGVIGASRRRIRTNNMIERLNREIHRRTRCRRQLPGRRQRADARMRAHTVRDRERVELAPLPRHVPGLAARWRKRTDHRAMDGHDPKCAIFRALPFSGCDCHT